MPRVSVIMNCYNGERYLREAIDSVYGQTFDDWEIIFWDNASTDGSAAIARSYDSRLRYFQSEVTVNLGDARRRAMSVAAGEWIAFLDCDDLWLPKKLEIQMGAVSNSDFVLCYAGVNEISPDGTLIRVWVPRTGKGDFLESLLVQFDVNMVTPIVRREVLLRHGIGFEPSITASEEYNLFLRIAAKGSVCALPDVIGVWRISSGSLTDRQIAFWAKERYFTLDQLEAENPGISARYPSAFQEARARGDYYKARYQMSIGQWPGAIRTMYGIAFRNGRYFLLFLAVLVPFAWGIGHSTLIKRRMIPMLLKLIQGKGGA